MNYRFGLTLIEVLLAVVLLALLAATAAPYLRARPMQHGIEQQSAFAVEVRGVLARIEQAQSERPSLMDIRSPLRMVQAECTPVRDDDSDQRGQWVIISRGAASLYYWVRQQDSGEVE